MRMSSSVSPASRVFLGTAACLGLVFLAGCGGNDPGPYLKVFDEQHAARMELARILAKITDEKSMTEAKQTLRDKLVQFDEIAKKAKALAEPSDKVRAELIKQKSVLERGVERVQSEIRRIQKLPGGEAFFDELKELRKHAGPNS